MTMRPLTITLAVTVLCQHDASGQEHHLAGLPVYQTPVPYANMRNADVTQNLGPTGARGWIFGHTENTLESREILVKSVEPGSPADGVLQPYDVITGAAVPPDTAPSQWLSAPALKPFDADARLSFARAITWAETEAAGGKLRLLRHRDGDTSEVVIELPVMGSYRETSPFDCPKSERIVEHAAAFLAANMPADGYPPGVGDPHNAGLLLACGNDAYLDHVRRSAMRMSVNHTISDAGHETWRWGNTNTFLCEYYLATGDERVLPTIRQYCKVLADGQCNPGTWGHRAVPDFIPPGYGSLNSSGVICFLSLVLGKQCGVNDADTALRRSIEFYGSYAGRGSIPYGDHPPSFASTSNGKNGPTALAFHLLGAEPAAQWFARLCASSNLPNLEGGHSGNYFNQTWSPLGAALSGRENTIAFWARLHAYRDLARRCDGSFITQPLPHTREGDLGTGNYVKAGPMWTTGSYALGYLVGNGRLAMFGRSDSVFAANPPKELEPALAHYRRKDFTTSMDAAANLRTHSDDRVRQLASQLADISQRNLNSIDLTIAAMGKSIESGDLNTLKWQLQAAESVIDANDPRLKPFHDALASDGAADLIAASKLLNQATTGVSFTGPNGYEIVATNARISRRDAGTLQQLAANGPEPLRGTAAAWIKNHPLIALGPNTTLPLVAVGDQPAGHLKATFTIDDPAVIDSLWLEYVMAGKLRVELNGTLVTHIKPTNGTVAKSMVPVRLKPSCLKLLKQGSNTLTAEFAAGGKGFDLKLKAMTR